MFLQLFYKRILRKLDLSSDQLNELNSKLQPQNICSGSFIEGKKMCPNTTALALKLEKDNLNGLNVRILLNNYGISNFELMIFYIIFDIPAFLSKRLFRRSLIYLRNSVLELIKEKNEKRN